MFSDLQPGGAFTLSQSRMNQIFGGSIADGPHTLHLLLLNSLGQTLASKDLTFTLDSSAV